MQILVLSDENQGSYVISRPVKSILQYRNVSPVCTADSRDGAPGSGSRSPRRPRRGCGWSDGPPAAGPTGAEPHGQRPAWAGSEGVVYSLRSSTSVLLPGAEQRAVAARRCRGPSSGSPRWLTPAVSPGRGRHGWSRVLPSIASRVGDFPAVHATRIGRNENKR